MGFHIFLSDVPLSTFTHFAKLSTQYSYPFPQYSQACDSLVSFISLVSIFKVKFQFVHPLFPHYVSNTFLLSSPDSEQNVLPAAILF